MARTRPHTQAEHKAFQDEFRSFFPPGLSSADIRGKLGIPERVVVGGPRNIDNNTEWNQIRDDIRKIMRNRNLDDPDEHIDIANEIGNLESLCRHTAEPRKFFEWFRYNHGRNTQKVERRKRITKTATGDQTADENECDRAGPVTADVANETETAQSNLITRDTNRRDWWNVIGK